MSFSYAFAPLVAWLVASALKSAINSIRTRRWQFTLIGYGGIPSTHTTIVSTTVTLIGFREGLNSPAYAVALTVGILVIMDALRLRRWIGRQGEAINKLSAGRTDIPRMQETVGHRPSEVVAGMLLGIACGYLLSLCG